MVASHFNASPSVVFAFQGLLSGCCSLQTWQLHIVIRLLSQLWILIGEIKRVLIFVAVSETQADIWTSPSLLASPQATIYPVSKARLPSRRPRLRTSSIRPSRPWAAAHWPIRGARARRPQQAWRPTCKVRRNASSCRTAGSWAAMWPWRAGEWPVMTVSGAAGFRYRCCYNTVLTQGGGGGGGVYHAKQMSQPQAAVCVYFNSCSDSIWCLHFLYFHLHFKQLTFGGRSYNLYIFFNSHISIAFFASLVFFFFFNEIISL